MKDFVNSVLSEQKPKPVLWDGNKTSVQSVQLRQKMRFFALDTPISKVFQNNLMSIYFSVTI